MRIEPGGCGSRSRDAAQLVDRLAVRLPLALEVGFGVKERFVVPFPHFETSEGVNFVHRPLEILGMIGLEEKFAARDEDAFQGVQERSLDDPALVVAGFWPWIGEEEMEARHGVRGQEPFDGVE